MNFVYNELSLHKIKHVWSKYSPQILSSCNSKRLPFYHVEVQPGNTIGILAASLGFFEKRNPTPVSNIACSFILSCVFLNRHMGKVESWIIVREHWLTSYNVDLIHPNKQSCMCLWAGSIAQIPALHVGPGRSQAIVWIQHNGTASLSNLTIFNSVFCLQEIQRAELSTRFQCTVTECSTVEVEG